jgi:hypothetical protein
VVLIVRSVGWTYYLSSQVGHLYFESASLQTPQEIAMSVGALFGGYMRRGWRNRFGCLSGRIACESRHLRRSCGEHFRDLHDESPKSINANIKSYLILYTNYTDKQPQHQPCLLHATAVSWISP